MERYQALRLIINQLGEIVPYLRRLETTLKPQFGKRGWRVFDVGVDVIETIRDKSPSYCVVVYDASGTVSAHSVKHAIKVPGYSGSCGVSSGSVPYPITSLLNLQFLEDLMAATAKA